MNPPRQNSTPLAASITSSIVGGPDLQFGDAPEHLTFDEMRELPMHLALGFDLEGEQ